MYDAYSLKTLRNLPVKIASIEAYDDILFVGTKEGHLFMYRVEEEENDFKLLRYKKNLSKRSINSLSAVKEYNILLVQAESCLTLYDIDLSLTNFPVISDLKEARGLSLHTVDVMTTVTLTGEKVVTFRVAVALRRKVLFYYWKNRSFQKLRAEMTLPDVPRAMAWAQDTLVLAFRPGEPYQFTKISDPDSKLTPTSVMTSYVSDPMIFIIKDQSKFALIQEEHTYFMNFEGKVEDEELTWLKTPLDMVYDSPFYISTNADCLDIMTESPSLLVQTIENEKPRFLLRSRRGYIYLASENYIWILSMLPISAQIPSLLEKKQFELAICLCNNLDDPSDESKTILRVKSLYALDLIVHKKFKEALDVFFNLDLDPSHVLSLFPNALPESLRATMGDLPEDFSSMEESDLMGGLPALEDYLLNFRNKMIGLPSKKLLSLHPLFEGMSVLKSKKKILMTIDTSLLLCYLQTTEALVDSLLRLKDNNCHVEETEAALKKANRTSSLIIFYNSKGLHREALSLLRKSSVDDKGAILRYLQRLGAPHLKLIFEFAEELLVSDPDKGIEVFVEDVEEVEGLPRKDVHEFLAKHNPKCAVKYLEHITSVWGEKNTFFHNQLVSDCTRLLQDPSFANDHQELQSSLYEHLKSSQYYEPRDLIFQFPKKILHEERALLLGRNGQHEDALFTYLYVVKDLPKALLYCSTAGRDRGTAYSLLVYLLLVSPASEKPLILDETGTAPDTAYELSDILSILQTHVREIDLNILVKHLPNSVPLSAIKNNLRSGISQSISLKHNAQIQSGLTHAEFLRLQKRRVLVESERIEMTDMNMCSMCKKRFTPGSTFVRLPEDFSVVHYSCQEKRLKTSSFSQFFWN